MFSLIMYLSIPRNMVRLIDNFKNNNYYYFPLADLGLVTQQLYNIEFQIKTYKHY